MSDYIKLPPLPTNVPHVTRRIQRTQVISAAEVVLEHFASEYARAAVLADRAARAGAVPEGWVLVPKEPNKAMVLAGKHTLKGCDSIFESVQAEMAYSSMIAAAPTQERGADDEQT